MATEMKIRRMSDVQLREVAWLWKPYIPFGKITIIQGDPGGNNSRVKNGYITTQLLEGATLTIHGYAGYTSYTLGDGTTTTEEITDAEYTYTATEACTVTITPVSGNNYFYGFWVAY